MLLPPPLLKKLDTLSLQTRRAFTGSSKGEKRSTKRGSSVEFADFRPYNPGDDIRRIDWNAYARFEKLFLKMFLEEEDLDITILIDASLSMRFGEPDSKLLKSQQIAAAVGYIGLTNFDRVGIAVFESTLRAWFPPTRGKGAVGQLFSFLEKQEADGRADFASAAKRVAAQARRSGVAIVLSDFLLEDGYEAGLKTLAARGYEVTAIQVLDKNELKPQLRGDLKLVDVETGATREVSVSDALLRTYNRNLTKYCDDLRLFCLRYGMNFQQVSTADDVEDVMLRMLRGTGVVK